MAASSQKQKKTIFVTVGTTLFEALIDAALKQSTLQSMVEAGYTHLIIQYGKGKKPVVPKTTRLSTELYDFKPSLANDMKTADLILSHAGAGTVMEVMRQPQPKKLVVVINDALMDNHQTELAYAMAMRHYLFVLEQPSQLCQKSTWDDSINVFEPVPYKGGDEDDFCRILNNFMGFSKETWKRRMAHREASDEVNDSESFILSNEAAKASAPIMHSLSLVVVA